MFTVNINPIYEAAVDYLEAAHWMNLFVHTIRAEKGSWWWDRVSANLQIEYTKRSERNDAAWYKLRSVCEVLDLNPEAVLAVVRSMERYGKNHGKYDRCLHLQKFDVEGDAWRLYYSQTERAFIRACRKPDWDADCWNSTGRRKNM